MNDHSEFGGSGNVSPSSPHSTGDGHRTKSTVGANDNTRAQVDSGGGDSLVAIIASVLQFALAEQQIAIAQDYYTTNSRDFNFIAQTFGGVDTNDVTHMGPMITHRNQAFPNGSPFYSVDYPVYIGGALTHTNVYDNKWFQTRRRAHRYAVGHQRHIDYQFYMARYRGAYSAFLMGRRVEDARKDMKDMQAQTHKVHVLNLGITAGNTARQGLASSVGTSMGALDKMIGIASHVSTEANRSAGAKSTKENATMLEKQSEEGKGAAT